MKRFKALSLLLIGGFLVFGNLSNIKNSEKANADITSPYSLNAGSLSWSNSGGTVTSNSVSWTYSSSTYLAKANTYYVQIGSKNNPHSSSWWSFVTAISSFGPNVKITNVSAVGYTAGSAQYSIVVSGVEKASGNLNSSDTTFSTGDISCNTGNIEIKFKASSKAMYFKSVTVSFENDTTTIKSLTSITGSLNAYTNDSEWNFKDIVVTATMSDDKTKDVTSECNLSASIAVPSQPGSGTLSITATHKTLTSLPSLTANNIAYSVMQSHSGLTWNDPFSVTEAIQHIDDDDLVDGTDYFTSGSYVKTSRSWKSSNNTICVVIADPNDSNKQFTFYNMSCSEEPSFTVGDTIIAYGVGSNYYLYGGTTYEINPCSMVEDTLHNNLILTSPVASFKAGQVFAGPEKVEATYLMSGNVDVTANVTYKIGDNSISIGDTIPKSFVSSNKQTVTVKYVDDNYDVATGTYEITINYADPTSSNISINDGEAYEIDLESEHKFTATISGQYVDTGATIVWSSSSNTVNDDFVLDEETGDFISGETGGTVVIRATVSGFASAFDEITVTISSNPKANLDIKTLADKFTGDSDATLTVTYSNFVGTPTVSWSSSNDDVCTVTQDATDQKKATVHYVGEGNAIVTVSVTLDSTQVSDTCDVSVTQSAVTSLTLDKTEASIFTNNSTTLTATVVKVGNATEDLTWTSSDNDTLTISGSGKTITVSALKAGTATITVQSNYTKSKTATCSFTITNEAITINWLNRGKLTFYRGDKFAFDDAASAVASFNSGKPSVDLTTFPDGFALRLFKNNFTDKDARTVNPNTYTFVDSDNGLKIALIYTDGLTQGKTTGSLLTITKWRNVMVSNESVVEYNLANSTALTVDGLKEARNTTTSTLDDITTLNSSSSTWENPHKQEVPSTSIDQNTYKIGASKSNGSITFTFASGIKINKVYVEFIGYAKDTNCELTVSIGDQSLSETAEKNYTSNPDTTTIKTFDFSSYETNNNVVVLSALLKSRVNILNLKFFSGGSQDIGKTSDCLGLESFITNNMHMDDEAYKGAGTGLCKTDGTYSAAKTAFNALNKHQKELFVSNDAYADEYARLSAWAKANGDAFDSNNTLVASSIRNLVVSKNTTKLIPVIISSIAILGAASFGIVLMLKRKKKEN